MENTNIDARIKAIIADKTDSKLSEVTDEANISEDLGTDSLDNIEIIMEIEKEFGISIPDDALEGEGSLVVKNIIAKVTDIIQKAETKA